MYTQDQIKQAFIDWHLNIKANPQDYSEHDTAEVIRIYNLTDDELKADAIEKAEHLIELIEYLKP